MSTMCAFCEHALGLFDDDSAVEGVLELIVALCVLDGFVQDGDAGDVRQRLGELHIGVGHRSVVDRNRLRAPITVPPVERQRRRTRTRAHGMQG